MSHLRGVFVYFWLSTTIIYLKAFKRFGNSFFRVLLEITGQNYRTIHAGKVQQKNSPVRATHTIIIVPIRSFKVSVGQPFNDNFVAFGVLYSHIRYVEFYMHKPVFPVFGFAVQFQVALCRTIF